MNGVRAAGSYLVDVLAKTNVRELNLFDDDVMKIHNAFRVAGAARVGVFVYRGDSTSAEVGAEFFLNSHAEAY